MDFYTATAQFMQENTKRSRPRSICHGKSLPTETCPNPASLMHAKTKAMIHISPSTSLSFCCSLPNLHSSSSLRDSMRLLNSFMNLVVPPASLVMVAFAWPALCFINAWEWFYNSFYSEKMEDKVVIITGASSAIGEQIAYEYGKRGANLVLVARREQRLRGISEKARRMGAKDVMTVAADVVKEDDCRRFVNQAVNYYGRLDHLVNTASLGQGFYFEEVTDTSVFPRLMDINFWGNVYPTFAALPYLHQSNGRIVVNASVENWLPLPRMSLYSAAKAALVNFYETLRFEVKGEDVGITIATHGWIGSEVTGGKFMQEEGAEMQWKEEREVNGGRRSVEEFARVIVRGACRGEAYVKYPSWYDVFLLYRAFSPNLLNWALRMLLSTHPARTAPPLVAAEPTSPSGSSVSSEGSSPRRLVSSPFSLSQFSPPRLRGE